MKFIVKLVLSLEKLLKNPVSWFSHQPWIVRVVLVLLIVPLISIISIITYQRFYLGESGINTQSSYEKSAQEISELRKDLERFHNSQIEEIAYLSEDIARLKKGSSEEVDVLGVNDEQVTDNLKLRLENIDLSKVDTDLIYIKTDISHASAFSDPSSSSQKLMILELGSFYPALIEKGDWQQIDLGGGKLGWVEKEFIIKFPVDEKN